MFDLLRVFSPICHLGLRMPLLHEIACATARYWDARAVADGRCGHAVPVGDPGRTMCELDARPLDTGARDWEKGSFRTKCTECIVAVSRVSVFHERTKRSW